MQYTKPFFPFFVHFLLLVKLIQVGKVKENTKMYFNMYMQKSLQLYSMYQGIAHIPAFIHQASF